MERVNRERIELVYRNPETRPELPAIHCGPGGGITFREGRRNRVSLLVEPVGPRSFRVLEPTGPVWACRYRDVISAERLGDGSWRWTGWQDSPYRQESFWFSRSAATIARIQPLLTEIGESGGTWRTWQRESSTILSVAYRLPYNPRLRLWQALSQGGSESGGAERDLEILQQWSLAPFCHLEPILIQISAFGGSWRIWGGNRSWSRLVIACPETLPFDPGERILEFQKALRKRFRSMRQVRDRPSAPSVESGPTAAAQ